METNENVPIPRLDQKRKLTFIIEKIPETTPSTDNIYITGEFNEWIPDTDFCRVRPTPEGKYAVSFETDLRVFEYKFTRGSWKSAECNAGGGQLPNRVYLDDEQTIIAIKIQNWEDKRPTISKNVHVLSHDFLIPQLNRRRRIWIYLPPNYKQSIRRYPVLYMHDGQNLFNEITSFNGEWAVDKALDRLYYEKSDSVIVVAIENGEAVRGSEYLPWIRGSEADAYSKFIVETLKPYIDSHFRTHYTREYTGIMGSAEGAAISFYTAMKYQEIFGKVGILSPLMGISDHSYEFVQKVGKQFDMKIYLLTGLLEGKEAVRDAQKLYDLLMITGFTKHELNLVIKYDGEHKEWFWQREFPAAFKWLYLNPEEYKSSSLTMF